MLPPLCRRIIERLWSGSRFISTLCMYHTKKHFHSVERQVVTPSAQRQRDEGGVCRPITTERSVLQSPSGRSFRRTSQIDRLIYADARLAREPLDQPIALLKRSQFAWWVFVRQMNTRDYSPQGGENGRKDAEPRQC